MGKNGRGKDKDPINVTLVAKVGKKHKIMQVEQDQVANQLSPKQTKGKCRPVSRTSVRKTRSKISKEKQDDNNNCSSDGHELFEASLPSDFAFAKGNSKHRQPKQG